MGNRLVCGCDHVYEEDIVKAFQQGARSFEDVQSQIQCGTGCGNCRILVEKVLRRCLEESRA